MAATKSSPEHWLSYRARRYLTHLTHSKNCFDDHKAKNKSKKKKKKKKKKFFPLRVDLILGDYILQMTKWEVTKNVSL